jgi:hypothetical protein
LAKANTAFQGASVGQPTEPCLAEMNERLMAFGDSLLAAPGRHPSLS